MRPEKQLLLNEIKEKMDQASMVVLTRYQKMTPNVSSQFRSILDKTGSGFEIVKKRILIKAAADSGFALDKELLQGHIGIIFTDQDPVQVTKTIYKFSQDNEELLEVLGGRFEGQICSAKDIKLIASLPNKEQMRAELLSVFEAPLSQVLGIVDALLTSPLYCMENKANAG